VPRVAVLTPRYLSRAHALGLASGSPRSRAVGAVVRALAEADDLPGPGDTRALVPPTGEAFVRRVSGRNLWVWYRPRGDELVLVTLTADPPVPLDE
jgi:hypothetical protein